MSRVADALQKKLKELGGVPDTSNELVLRTMADVPDDWQLQGSAPVEQPPITKLVPPAPAAPPREGREHERRAEDRSNADADCFATPRDCGGAATGG